MLQSLCLSLYRGYLQPYSNAGCAFNTWESWTMGEGLWFSATLKEGSKAKSVWSRTLIDWRSFKAISWGSYSVTAWKTNPRKGFHIQRSMKTSILEFPLALNSLWFTLPGPLKAWRMKRLGKADRRDRSVGAYLCFWTRRRLVKVRYLKHSCWNDWLRKANYNYKTALDVNSPS